MRFISKALTRHNLVFGAESEFVGFLGILCGVIIYAETSILNFILAAVLWFVGLYFLQRLAKKDPMFFKVYQCYLGYQNFYSAKTPKWRIGSGYKAK